MNKLGDAEKAKWYRQKLVDLLEAADVYFTDMAIFGATTDLAVANLENEINTIRQQLEVEEQFEAKNV